MREDVKDFLKINKLSVTVQPGGKSHEKGCRKLAFACVSAFSWDLTSGGRPKLLVPDAFRGQEDDLAELLHFIPIFQWDSIEKKRNLCYALEKMRNGPVGTGRVPGCRSVSETKEYISMKYIEKHPMIMIVIGIIGISFSR